MLMINNSTIPSIGLGTWKSNPGKVKDAIICAIKEGYRHIDCAHVYGNEAEIGSAFKELFDNNIIERSELFITSKLWNNKHRTEDVEGALLHTLKNLNLDYLDLYLIHWPVPFQSGDDNFPKDKNDNIIHTNTHYIETWMAMEDLVRKGLVKTIGLSNFNIDQIEDIIKISRVPISVLQIENHLYLTQDKLVEFAHKNNIVVTAYSPLGSPDRPWGTNEEPNLLEDKLIKELALKYNKTPAQILIKFLNQKNLVVIPKSVTPQRIKENIDIFDFDIENIDMLKLIKRSNKSVWRACIPKSMNQEHPYYPF